MSRAPIKLFNRSRCGGTRLYHDVVEAVVPLIPGSLAPNPTRSGDALTGHEPGAMEGLQYRQRPAIQAPAVVRVIE